MQHFQITPVQDVLVAQLVDPQLFHSLILDELQDELLEMIERRQPRKLVISFDGVSQCSTSVINALLAAKKLLRTQGGDVKLCQLHPAIREAYRLLNLDGTVFKIYDSQADAIAAFGESAD